MINASSEFDSKVVAQTELRKWDAEAIYRNVDTTAKPDCSSSANETHPYSDPSYSIDGDYRPTYNYATFEEDRWLLDGSFALAPDDDVDPIEDIPDMNNTLCTGISQQFSTPWVKTYSFSGDHSSSGISIYFDDVNGEYAVDFTIVFKDSGGSTIETITETANTDSIYINETAVNNYRSIVITINEWSKPVRLARIAEVYFGIVKHYSKENGLLIDLEVNEQFDNQNLEVRGNDVKFTIDNTDDDFNPINPEGIYEYIQQKQEIETRIGLYVSDNLIEWIPLGKFYLKNIEANEDRTTATFTGGGWLYFMDQLEYGKVTYATGVFPTLYEEIENLLTDFGLTSDQYEIDSAFSSESLINYMPVDSYKQTLIGLVMYANGIVYEDREGKVIVKQLDRTPESYDLNKDNMFKVPIVRVNEPIYEVQTYRHSYVSAGSKTQVAYKSIPISGTEEVKIYHDSPINIDNASSSVTGGGVVVNSTTYYTNFTIFNVTASGTVTFDIDGKVLTIGKVLRKKTSDIYANGEALVVDNSVFYNFDEAEAHAEWLIDEGEYNRELIVDWRQNPAVELTDTLSNVETQFEDAEDYTVVENKLVFNGALKGRTVLRGK